MRNTYINDELNSIYPFCPGGALAFPLSCITNAGFNILTDDSVRVYVSTIGISADHISASICVEYPATGKKAFVGVVDIDLNSSGKTGYLRSVNPEIRATGYMVAGNVPASAYGVYTDELYITPECVFCTKREVYGLYDNITINDITYPADSVLRISADGDCEISGNAVLNISDEDSDGYVNYTVRDTYPIVTSINNQSISGPAGTTLTMTTASPDAVKFSVDVQKDSPCVQLIVDGTKKFPNCYAETEDEAME